jgi:hypothetical protein
MPTDVNDRLRDSIREIVKSLLPTIDYHAFYTYVVVSWNNDSQKADLQPFKRPDMPTLQGVPVRSPGERFELVSQTNVLVGFENGDPGAPYVAFLDYAGAGQSPARIHILATTEVKIGPDPALPAARQGDMVACGGNGTFATFYLTPTDVTPVPMTTMTPYLISFSGSPPPYPPVPGLPPPLQGSLYGFVSSGSPYIKE